jgi:hypothetical protein
MLLATYVAMLGGNGHGNGNKTPRIMIPLGRNDPRQVIAMTMNAAGRLSRLAEVSGSCGPPYH